MQPIEEKFAKLDIDYAPGQQVRQGDDLIAVLEARPTPRSRIWYQGSGPSPSPHSPIAIRDSLHPNSSPTIFCFLFPGITPESRLPNPQLDTAEGSEE